MEPITLELSAKVTKLGILAAILTFEKTITVKFSGNLCTIQLQTPEEYEEFGKIHGKVLNQGL